MKEIQEQWDVKHKATTYKEDWGKVLVGAIHTYTYSCWKDRNDAVHMRETGSKIRTKKQKQQERVVDLYGRGRDNLTIKERKYFKLPVEQRIKKGVTSMELWINIVEIIFKRRGETRQEKLDSWLTNSTPEKSWKDKYKYRAKSKDIKVEEIGIP